ncbi:hypothetical protein QQS21_002830 [Conoideocrella luteorostrata]|uniref:NACHT-NTPase and P-loop NTPases N-terminal domain-containing protein n=1 Tax=Conoideocrella luteorostrata TaxID=1105319 RepID=A0AAJ0CWX6_9HYPO|nr:hypothetical protein QQS21_002830 [Conoideocrella luteorostrata]
MPREVTKTNVIRCLRDAIDALEKASKSCDPVHEAANVPSTAFTVVANHISTVLKLFTSINTVFNSLENDKQWEEQGQLSDMYPKLCKVTKDCSNHARCLEDLFETVTENGDDAETKIKKYRSVVQDNQGKKVEDVMLDLLNAALLAAVKPLVGDEQIQELREALQEVNGLPPSLVDSSDASVIMNNYQSGSQFYNGGPGDQNHCSGGFMVTGKPSSSTFNYHSKAAPAVD